MHLVAEFAASQHAFITKTQKPGEIMGGLALVQFTRHPAPIVFIVQGFKMWTVFCTLPISERA